MVRADTYGARNARQRILRKEETEQTEQTGKGASMTIGNDLTPAQCRAARALLHWSQADLANKAGIAKRTVSYFESDLRPLNPRTRRALAEAFNKAGITVDPQGGIRRGAPGRGDTLTAHDTPGEDADIRGDQMDLALASDPLEIARRWRTRSEEYRSVADTLQTPAVQQTYARLARTYENVARHMEKRAQGSPHKHPARSRPGHRRSRGV